MDVTGLEGTYRPRARAGGPRAVLLARRARTAGALGVLVLVALALGRLALAAVDGGWTGALRWLTALAWVAVAAAAAGAPAALAPLVRVEPGALVVRPEALRRARAVPWRSVVAVEPPGPSGPWSTAVLTGGERLPLPGLPPERAGLLAAAVARSRSPGPSQPPALPRGLTPGLPRDLPPDDEGMEGPFHRGPRRG